jgi:hypothetical protein
MAGIRRGARAQARRSSRPHSSRGLPGAAVAPALHPEAGRPTAPNPGRECFVGAEFVRLASGGRRSNRRSLSCTHRPLVAEGNAVAIERGSLVIVVFLMRARGIPLPPPVCPSASEIAARSPRITAARDGVAAAPGLSCQRASGQCDVDTVRPPDSPPLSPACGKQNSDTCFDQ